MTVDDLNRLKRELDTAVAAAGGVETDAYLAANAAYAAAYEQAPLRVRITHDLTLAGR